CRLVLLSRRQRIVGKIYVLEVGGHLQRKIANLRDVLSAGLVPFTSVVAAEAVTPIIQALRLVLNFQRRGGSGLHANRAAGAILRVRQSHRQIIHRKRQVVVDRLRRGKVEPESYVLIFVARVLKRINAVEPNLISAVPKQTFLPMIETKIDVYVTALQRQPTCDCFLRNSNNLLSIFGFLFLVRHHLFIRSYRWHWILRRAPARADAR